MKLRQDFVVGIIFFVSMVVVGFFTIVVKDVTLLQGRIGQMSVVFDRVDGLEVGHKVLASGMEVGTVSSLDLQENGQVVVDINLTRPLTLYDGYAIKVRDASALGGKFVDINIGADKIKANQEEPLTVLAKFPELGKMTTPIPEDRNFEGRAKPSLLDNPDISELVSSLKKIAKNLEQGQGTIGLLIQEREIYDNIRDASENLKKITEQLQKAEGTLGKLLYSEDLYKKIDTIASNIEDMTNKLNRGEGTLGKLINDDEIYVSLKGTMANADKVMANIKDLTDRVIRGEGTVGKLFTDDKVYNELENALTDARTMIQNINTTVSNINQGQGALGMLMQDEKVAQSLKATLENIEVVSERLKKGEGTIGKLMADDELYQEIRRLVQNFSDSLEDTREQVPITTFTNILFRAF